MKRCTVCRKSLQQRPQPLLNSELPQLPWQKLGTDLFEWRHKHYLIVIDYYSRYVEIALLTSTTADEVIKHTKSIFARHGIPELLVSDNGPQYSSSLFAEFAKAYEFKHVTSSPYHPQANGEAERAVGTVKRLLQKNEDPYLALLAYRTTPLRCGFSPSQLLMGRNLRTTVPTTRAHRTPIVVDAEELRKKERDLRERQKQDFNRHHGARKLPDLKEGDQVWLPDRATEGTVGEEVSPRSYEVTTADGVYRRNRQDILQLPNPPLDDQQDSSEDSQATGQDQPTDEEDQPPEQEQVEVRRSSRELRKPPRWDPSWS